MVHKVVSLVKTQGVFNKRSCMDCKERMNINNFPVISYGCRHYPKTCHMCLLVRINDHMDAGNRTPLPCPYPNCTQCLTSTAIMRMPYSKQLMYEYMVAVSPDDNQQQQQEGTNTTVGDNQAAGDGGDDSGTVHHRDGGHGDNATQQQQTATTSTSRWRGTAITSSNSAAVAAAPVVAQ